MIETVYAGNWGFMVQNGSKMGPKWKSNRYSLQDNFELTFEMQDTRINWLKNPSYLCVRQTPSANQCSAGRCEAEQCCAEKVSGARKVP